MVGVVTNEPISGNDHYNRKGLQSFVQNNKNIEEITKCLKKTTTIIREITILIEYKSLKKNITFRRASQIKYKLTLTARQTNDGI